MDSPTAEQNVNGLEKYCKNLTALARKENSTPSSAAMRRSAARCRSFPAAQRTIRILIGDPGVGKTAIAEGLAQRIIQEDVPDSLKGNRCSPRTWEASSPALNSEGNLRRGSKGSSTKWKRAKGKILLFIDEVHTLDRRRRCRRVNGCGKPVQTGLPEAHSIASAPPRSESTKNISKKMPPSNDASTRNGRRTLSRRCDRHFARTARTL